MFIPHKNRSMDVSDIVGSVKKDRYGHRLTADPLLAGQFAGIRKGADLLSSKGKFIKPDKNISIAFSHLDTSVYRT